MIAKKRLFDWNKLFKAKEWYKWAHIKIYLWSIAVCVNQATGCCRQAMLYFRCTTSMISQILGVTIVSPMTGSKKWYHWQDSERWNSLFNFLHANDRYSYWIKQTSIFEFIVTIPKSWLHDVKVISEHMFSLGKIVKFVLKVDCLFRYTWRFISSS